MNFWNAQRVLVTGGSGFVGRWVSRALVARGAELHIVDLAPSRADDAPHTFHTTDLRQLDAVLALLERVRPASIIHLAGQPGVGASHANPLAAFEANVTCTMMLLEACRRWGQVQSLVAVSSNHVYGEQHQLPTAEDARLEGVAAYAATKLAADVLARSYGKTYDLPVGIARMTNSFGGDDHHTAHIITGSLLAALRGERPVIKQSGNDRKGYLYIKDTAAGLLAIAAGVAASPELRGEAFNLCPNEAVSVLELVEAVLAAAGRTDLAPVVERPDAPAENEHLDNRKARELLGWKPQYSLAAALAETVDWYRTHAT